MSFVSYWTRSPTWKKGLGVSLGVLAILALLTFLGALLPFDGLCGSGLMFSARYPCTFGQRAFEALLWLELMVLLFWPLVLGILVIFPLLGGWLGRRGRRSHSTARAE